jgi:REP element-mobilizing transposase RayT
MGYARKSLICLSDTPYYHIVSRCVRRAWLWGYDTYAGKDYSHRKLWVMQRLRHLGNTFAIDLCAYAIMSNHYHLVLRVDRERAAQWSTDDIVKRWTRLFGRPLLIKRWQSATASAAERAAAERLIERWRSRLIDISWYMRCLNEHLARRANDEDQCTGRFWEGRFKSQALLDEAGLLTAMVYVDLNPIRAGIAETPEQSEHTSIYARIQQHTSTRAARRHPEKRLRKTKINTLTRFGTPSLLAFHEAGSQHPTLPMQFIDYLQLVDWTGRITRADKQGAIEHGLPPVLMRLQIDPCRWMQIMRPGGNLFGRALGRYERLRSHAARLGQSWIKGLHAARRLYCCT